MIGLAALVLWGCSGKYIDTGEPVRDPSVDLPLRSPIYEKGEVVEYATTTSIQGLIDDHGEAILFNRWEYWCGPCMSEMPRLAEINNEIVLVRGITTLYTHDDLYITHCAK